MDVGIKFNSFEAEKYLRDGYCVRGDIWEDGAFVYYCTESHTLKNEEDVSVGWSVLGKSADKRFEFLPEGEESLENVGKEEDGIQEVVEQKNKLQEEGKPINLEKTEKNILNQKQQDKKDLQETEEIIKQTKKNKTENELNAEGQTLKQQDNITENTITNTKQDYFPTSLEEEGNVTQQSDSLNLSLELKKEKSSSIELLNGSTQLMMNLATDLTHAREGAVPSKENIKVATELLKEVRNTMKTKLDYLKFAKELIK